MKKILSRMSALALVLSLLIIIVSPAHAAPGNYLFEWGAKYHFLGASGLAADRQGNIYVADSGGNRIEKLTCYGQLITTWGSKGSGNGEFMTPYSVAVDGSGNVYVADTGNNRIQKFQYSGASHRYVMVRTWGGAGDGEGQFNLPLGVAVDRSGNVFVADSGNNRVQKFDGSGRFLTAWGSAGSEHGQFLDPTALAIDNSGRVYVVDTQNTRVQIFKYDQTIHSYIYDFQLGDLGGGSRDGEFIGPRGVAIDRSGNAYVTDPGNHRVQKFSSSGRYLLTFEAGPPLGEFYIPFGITADATGHVYVSDPYVDRIQKFDGSTGELDTSWDSFGNGPGQLHWPSGVAIDGSGNVYLTDFNNRIQKFDAFGKFQLAWGSYGNGDGQFINPAGLAADRNGSVYVADNTNNRIQKFDSSGHFLLTWGHAGMGNGNFSSPVGVALDAIGNVYVADYWGVQKFDSNGMFLTGWGGYGHGSGEFIEATGIAVDANGNVFVVDSGNNRIQKFDGSGRFLTTWGSEGTGNGQFSKPSGIAADDTGHVFVVDTNNSRVQVFDYDGNFLTSWGKYGSGKREFIYLDYGYFQGIATTPSGTAVYVADTVNNRIQVLAGYSVPTVVFSAGPNGRVVGATSQTVSFGGMTKPVLAVPQWGYRFLNWTDGSGNVVSRENPLVVRGVTTGMVFKANFQPYHR